MSMTFAEIIAKPAFAAMVAGNIQHKMDAEEIFQAWIRGGHRAACRVMLRHRKRDGVPWIDLGGEA